jgi:hypothetical protein
MRYTLQMDPEDRTTQQSIGGDLVHCDLTSLETPGGASLPFDTRKLLARLDKEPGDVPGQAPGDRLCPYFMSSTARLSVNPQLGVLPQGHSHPHRRQVIDS